MARQKYFVGIDLGGTKILTTLLNRRFEVISEKKSRIEPNRGEKQFFKTVLQDFREVLDEGKVSAKQLIAAGMGCPGIIEFPEGFVKVSPNISFLKNCPLGARLKSAFKIPVIVENDVNAGLYGEQQFGAARGSRHVIGIFMGTGVGGAMILDGSLYRGAEGAAGEIGHTFLGLPSFGETSLNAATLESRTGRLAIATEAALLVMKQKAPKLYSAVGFDVRKIRSKALLKAIRSGDQAVRELLLAKARLMGLAMANVVNLLNPELFVLGGGLVEAMAPVILPEARAVMKRYALDPLARNVKVVPARLGDYAIVLGAAKLAWDHLESRRSRGGKK